MLKLMIMYFIGWFALYFGWKVFNVLYALLEWLETRKERKNEDQR